MVRILFALVLSAILVLCSSTPAGARAGEPPPRGGGAIAPAPAMTLLAAATAAGGTAAGGTAAIPTAEPWRWPVSPVRVLEPFVAPPHAYGPGHRGIDLAAEGVVVSPAGGTVAFVGVVVDRAVLTIDHGDGLVTTLEPVETDLVPGDVVGGGDAVGTVSAGGHTAPGSVHFGVRLHGEYVNPMLLLDGIPRAVLLPCC